MRRMCKGRAGRDGGEGGRGGVRRNILDFVDNILVRCGSFSLFFSFFTFGMPCLDLTGRRQTPSSRQRGNASRGQSRVPHLPMLSLLFTQDEAFVRVRRLPRGLAFLELDASKA